MSIRSLADFMEVSPRSVRRLDCTATVTGRGDPLVDASARGADFSWPKAGTSGGHQCGLFMAISADFLVATDTRQGGRAGQPRRGGRGSKPIVGGVQGRGSELI